MTLDIGKGYEKTKQGKDDEEWQWWCDYFGCSVREGLSKEVTFEQCPEQE